MKLIENIEFVVQFFGVMILNLEFWIHFGYRIKSCLRDIGMQSIFFFTVQLSINSALGNKIMIDDGYLDGPEKQASLLIQLILYNI